MASFFSTTYIGTILINLFSGSYIALSTTAPTAAGGNITEPSAASGYARVAASTGGMTVSGNTITNGNFIYWPEATASWGTVTYIALMTAASGGSMRYAGEITPSGGVSVGANTVPLFRPGALSVSITSGS